MTRLLVCLPLALALPAVVAAQSDEPRVVKLTLHPAAAPEDALEYQLLPAAASQTPGNAALLYYRAAVLVPGDLKAGTLWDKLSPWATTRSADFPLEEARKVLSGFSASFHELELAARRSRCEWQLPIESEGFNLRLEELSALRHLARALAGQARLQIAEGRIDEALRTIQTGMAMSRHLAEGGTLIHTLVGNATAELMTMWLSELLQRPAAPNLYWALTVLPQPFIDARPALEQERNTLFSEFPLLRDAERAPLSPHQAAALKQELLRFLSMDSRDKGAGKEAVELRLTAIVMGSYPQAKKALIAHGRSAAEVEAMPALQAVTVYSLAIYRQVLNDSIKWLYLPYWQGDPGIERSQQTVDAAFRKEGIPFAAVLLPSFRTVYAAPARLDRQIAALRVIEACRLYAAAHAGKLPASLDAVTEVPLPLDPMSGKPFVYKLAGDQATLESSGGEWNVHYATRYTLTMAR